MKKLLYTLSFIALTSLMISCGGSNTTTGDTACCHGKDSTECVSKSDSCKKACKLAGKECEKDEKCDDNCTKKCCADSEKNTTEETTTDSTSAE